MSFQSKYNHAISRIVENAVEGAKLENCISIEKFNDQVYASINNQVHKNELALKESIEVLKNSPNATFGINQVPPDTKIFPFPELAISAMQEDCSDFFHAKYKFTDLKTLVEYFINEFKSLHL